nr:hypothetical protein [Tanacetum cinerariifolium]
MIIEVPQLSKSTHDVADEHVTTTSNDPLSGEDRLKLSELMELCTQLQSRVLVLETTKANQALEIESLKRMVKKLKKKASKKTHKLKRLYKIGSSTRVESSEDAGLGNQEDASKQWRMIADLDANEGVALRIEEENESAELKRCLEIIPNNNDDVTIEATPLSSKSPTIVDYKIYKEGRKSFFKIISVDDTMSFDDLYNNFKIVEQNVKGTVTSSSNSSSQNMAFVSSPSSTNEVNTANTQVSPASTKVSTASTQDSTAKLSDPLFMHFWSVNQTVTGPGISVVEVPSAFVVV